jgi:aminoglycoside 3-N-acetyltransferase
VDEAALIAATDVPRTAESLARDLRALGVRAGDTLIVHASMRALGWVAGGTQGVLQALMDAVTPDGTLVMPSHTGHISDPANWRKPPVPESWLKELYAAMPAYDPATTQTRGLGAIAEHFRTWPGVVRSAHPVKSFAAWGAGADEVVGGQELDWPLGESSPLARIYDRDGGVLFLGAPFARNTSCHLAEYRVPGGTRVRSGAPMMVDGKRRWVSYEDWVFDVPFASIGEAYLAQPDAKVRRGRVGSADSMLISQRDVVDFAVSWLAEQRGIALADTAR